MTVVLRQPAVDDLAEVVQALRAWQYDGAAMQLHPGDLGWFWRFGAEATAAAVRTWSQDEQLVAVGLLDGPGLIRLAVAPALHGDEATARQVVAGLTELSEGPISVEAPAGAGIRDVLQSGGWQPDEPWTQLRRDLAGVVPTVELRIEVAGPAEAPVRAVVQRAAFDSSTFTADRWQAMAEGQPYGDARCLLGYDAEGNAVAAVTVWSAGAGKPGLLEPMGVHRDHRGRGYGRAITLAAAAALQELGSSSAMVCTPSANAGGVATYEAAGFVPGAQVQDLRRDG